ncbi:MAG: transporter substrate-binding domain-containing protein, partial [Desulfamplus sp.]|nr:transporter substrate-binding domain-containing protein [Desulfamplus sp.]
ICHAEVKELSIATDEWPPYEFKTGVAGNESITGFSTEVIIAVMKTLNVGIKDRIKQYPWARAEQMVIKGDADLLYTAANNPEREKITYYAAEPLVSSSWSFFIRAEDAGKLKYDSFDDLKGQKIGVVRGYSYTKELWDFLRAANLADEVVSDDVNIKKLVGKRFNYIVMDSLNGLYLLKQMGLADKVVQLPKPLQVSNLYCVFSRNTIDKDFVDKFSAELKTFKATEEYKTIFDKYFGKK